MGHDVLNPMLYRRLAKVYGQVRVSNAGEAMKFRTLRVDDEDDGPDGRKVRQRSRLVVTHKGEYYSLNCFAPETLVATPAGDVPIKELAGTSMLLIPNARGLGSWKSVEVQSFGRQRLLRLHLCRRGTRKVIRVTADHRWVIHSGAKELYAQRRTHELVTGDRLASCFARTVASYRQDRGIQVSAAGVARGFTFGAGSCAANGRSSASVRVMAAHKDEALLPFFTGIRRRAVVVAGSVGTEVCDLPRYWKQLPPADESLSYLLGWFAGYFAADGHVARSGRQATIYSANEAHLQFVKGICYQLGIRVSPILVKRRRSGGCVPDVSRFTLYSLSFPVRDMPAEFWILEHHKARAAAWTDASEARQRSYWTVERVEDAGDEDEVFCAVVPGVEKFTLADNLMTMNCPFCKDTRKRLYVNHMFGKRDESGRRMTFLAYCFNENCLDRKENRDRFVADLQAMGDPIEEYDVRPGRVVSEEAHEVDWPGPCVPLADLPVTHVGRAYLEDRGFDARTLTAKFGVAWCTDSRFFLARDRIIIPVFDRGKLKGWQARYPGELPWKDPDRKKELPPKYFSCPGARFRSQCILNFDAMKKWQSGVLVEGPTDVFRGGSMFGGIFGNTVTDTQKRRLTAVFGRGDRTLVLCLDPEERDSLSTRRAVQYFHSRMPGRFCPVWLPEGTDPGGLDRDWLKAFIKEEAARQGVKVTYRMVGGN